jgi:tetratricopeptide (TPR) repeat protein
MKGEAESGAALVRSDVLVLLREKRYEEALSRLYQARAETPDSVELQKGIDQVKEFLTGAYAKRLGGLDQVARLVPPVSGRSPDMVLLSRYIDGVTTYADLAAICPLGKLRTLQVLVEMYAPKSAGQTAAEAEAQSGARPLDTGSEPRLRVELVAPEEPVPQTARSGTTETPPPASVPVDDSPEAREYRAAFGRGTAAFIQHRFADAIEAFEACLRLRPGDQGAEVMLRRARRDFESRV